MFHVVALCGAFTGLVTATHSASAQPNPPSSPGATKAAPATAGAGSSAASATASGASATGSANSGATGSSVPGSNEYAQFRKAHDAMRAENWQEARRILLGLWDKSNSYDVGALLGQVEFKLGHYGLATRRMAFALAHIPPKEKPETRERLQAAFKEIRSRAGALRVAVASPNLRVFVDNENVGSTPFDSEVYVDPGTHQVELKDATDRAVASNRNASVAAGQVAVVDLPITAADASGAGAISNPNGADPNAPPGVGTSNGIDVGSTSSVPPVGPERHKSLVPVYVAGGVAAAGLAVAIGFGVASRSAKNKAEDFQSTLGPSGCSQGAAAECDELRDARDEWRRDARLANIGWAAFGVGVAAAGVWLLLPGPRHETAAQPSRALALRANVQPEPHGARFSLGGQF